MANGNGTGENLAFTKFMFVALRRDDDAAGTRLRTAGSAIARGFFNDFDADGSREIQPHESIQFYVASSIDDGATGFAAARYAVQVSGKYRPRLQDTELELRRRLGDAADIIAIDGAVRPPRYTSAELYDYAYRKAPPRRSGRVAPHAFILPINKSADWWRMPPLERHAYFYPHTAAGGAAVPGHAQAAHEGIPSIFRRLYHNPDGYERPGEFDFLASFECEDGHVATFDRVHEALRDTTRNPEWRYVVEGPLWRGRRVLRW